MQRASTRRRQFRWTPLLLVALLFTGARADAAITSASVDREGPVTELDFTLDAPAPRLHLTAHAGELQIDLDRTALHIPSLPILGRDAAPIRMLRARTAGTHTQIVVEVMGKSDYAIIQRQREIVLRLAPAGVVADLRAPMPSDHALDIPPAPLAAREIPHAEPVAIIPPSRAIAPPVAEALAGDPLVMIDPGHGGYDPGTQSSSGILEKDVALSIARRLAYALKARGVRVQLTRDSDDFIPLSERTRRANVADADLFVSIHLNSSPNAATTGIEVYYLNNTTDRATIRLARMENAGVTGAGAPIDGNLNYILADLRQNYKANEAASLARSIDTQAVNDLDARLGLEVNPLGAKMGPFYVLVGAHMPAVLVECGFLSNPYEAQRLASANYQEVLAEGIATAVTHHLNSEAAMGNL
jgi:N-acetylmuramoyl-L-alanine amidase